MRRIRSTGYHFLWSGKREEGGLGIRDFKTLNEAATIREATRSWEDGCSAWVEWVKQRYVKGRGLEEIESRQGDSTHWKAIIAAKPKIRKFISLGANGTYEWRGKGDKGTLRNIFNTVRRRREADEYSGGI